MTESFKAHLIDSLRFTRETVAGDATRSITFILACLCAGLSMISGQFLPILSSLENVLHVPYLTLGAIIILGTIIVLFWIALAGYGVRVFRGGSAPPSFTPVKILMKDGLLVQVPLTLWLIPVYLFGAVSIGALEIFGIRISNLLWLGYYFLAPAICFLYANTGNVIESTRPLKILLTIKNSSGFFYTATFFVFIAVSLVYTWIVWVLTLILAYVLPFLFTPASYNAVLFFFSPIYMIFTARFFTNILGKQTTGDSIGIVEVN
ncbi:MAG: hypothetical protein M0Q92_01050 [Methanoregula sp.]|jgi:hypothetical protein|nr:hypothetical protein [Methanoregula sp.]